MFGAHKQSRYANDSLATYMFSFLREDMCEDLFVTVEVLDLIEECKTYVFRDRPLQVNAIIEAELNEDYALCDELAVEVHQQDTTVLCNLVKIRNYIYA